MKQAKLIRIETALLNRLHKEPSQERRALIWKDIQNRANRGQRAVCGVDSGLNSNEYIEIPPGVLFICFEKP
jgi:hypothetical protein